MSDGGSAELPVVVSLTDHANRTVAAAESVPPIRRAHPSEAVTVYAMAARLAELQLELAEQGNRDDPGLAATRDALHDAHRIACAGMGLDADPPARPALRLVRRTELD